jgi:hypothetical protein
MHCHELIAARAASLAGFNPAILQRIIFAVIFIVVRTLCFLPQIVSVDICFFFCFFRFIAACSLPVLSVLFGSSVIFVSAHETTAAGFVDSYSHACRSCSYCQLAK